MATTKLKHPDSGLTVETENPEHYVSQGWYDPSDKDAAKEAKTAAAEAAPTK